MIKVNRYTPNFIKVDFKLGEVINFFYWIKHGKKKRIYSFFGVIVKKTYKSIHVVNTFNTELINFKLPVITPVLLKVFNMKLYKRYLTRLNKLNFLFHIDLQLDIFENVNLLNSSQISWNYEMLCFFPPRIYSILYFRKGRRQFLVYRHRI